MGDIFLYALLVGNLVGIFMNGVSLGRTNREQRRIDHELADLRAMINGEPRDPFPYQER